MENIPGIPSGVFERRFPDGFTLRDEANAIVAQAFRNGPIENLHAGKYSELLSDSSLSRITDKEMKEIMINACKCVEKLLRVKEEKPKEYNTDIKKYNIMYCNNWER